jgi:hypothetical protein
MYQYKYTFIHPNDIESFELRKKKSQVNKNVS